MPEPLRELLLASYADMGEAMVVRSVLEARGVTCRIGDLANLPTHVFGIAGGLRRSVGLYVLETDVERASAVLASGMSENEVDEEALAAAAMAAAPEGAEVDEAAEADEAAPSDEAEQELMAAPLESAPPAVQPTHSPWLARAIFAFVVAFVALLVSRACG